MPDFCAAYGCSNRCCGETRSRGITFHLFPKNGERRRKWELALRRKGFAATDRTLLCSEHFRSEDFDRTGQTVRLKDGVVPSIFNFPAHLQRSAATGTTTTSGRTEDDLPTSLSQDAPQPDAGATGQRGLSHKQRSTDHLYALPTCPKAIKAKYEEALARVRKLQWEKSNALRREKRAKNNMQALLEELKEKNVISEELKDKLECYSDEPLKKKKRNSATTEKPMTEIISSDRSISTNDKKAGVNTDDSSDNEPLIKIAKNASKGVKVFSVSPKKPTDTKKEELLDKKSSDEEPLSNLAKTLNCKHQRNTSVVSQRETTLPVSSRKQRNSARKIGKCLDTSSDSSDNEQLATVKGKLTKIGGAQERPAKSQQTKSNLKDKSLKDSSSDDNVPLANLIGKKAAKKSAEVSMPRKRQGFSNESSDDEPLINLVNKKCTETQMKAAKKRDVTRQTQVSGLSNNGSREESLIKAAEHPQVTKVVWIILERCDSEQTV